MNYDFSKFHKGHNKQVIVAPDGMHIVCLDCGISANMEAVSGKCTPAEICKITPDRQTYGKQSNGVDRGESK